MALKIPNHLLRFGDSLKKSYVHFITQNPSIISEVSKKKYNNLKRNTTNTIKQFDILCFSFLIYFSTKCAHEY